MWRSEEKGRERGRSLGSHLLDEAAIQGFVDDMLAPRRRLEIEEYLSHRPGKAARARDFRAQNRGFHEFFDRYLAAPLPRETELLEFHLLKSLVRRRRVRRYGWITVAAATVVVAFALGGFIGTRSLPAPSDIFAAFLPSMSAEIQGGSSNLKPIRIETAARAGAGPSTETSGRAAPDLKPFGFKLIGTRLLASDREIVQFVFESDAGRRVMLYLAAADHVERQRISLNAEGPLSVLSWSNGSRSYNLIGEIDRDTILAIGRAINGDALTPGGKAGSRQGSPLAPSTGTDKMPVSSSRDVGRQPAPSNRP